MRSWIRALGLSALLAGLTLANEAELVRQLDPYLCARRSVLTCRSQTQDASKRLQCSGMYSRKAWGGNTDPFILTKFAKLPTDGDFDPIVSLLIFEWSDEPLIGRRISDDPEVCDTFSQLLRKAI